MLAKSAGGSKVEADFEGKARVRMRRPRNHLTQNRQPRPLLIPSHRQLVQQPHLALRRNKLQHPPHLQLNQHARLKRTKP